MRHARLGLLLLMLALSGCGFQLRGTAKLPFDTISVPSATQLAIDIQRNIVAGTTAKIVPRDRAPQAILDILGEVREKVILSLNTQGRVREYQLRYLVVYRVHDGKGGEFIPSSQIVLRRDITFNDQVLAKETEEALLYREMQTDMVQQILRRLQAAKLRDPEDE
jgi:LPS-assembly lipoprotein